MKDILTTISMAVLCGVFGAMLVLIIRVVWCICTGAFIYNKEEE